MNALNCQATEVVMNLGSELSELVSDWSHSKAHEEFYKSFLECESPEIQENFQNEL